MEKMKSCGNCAEACGIEGKNEVVGCKEDGKLHNAQEQLPTGDQAAVRRRRGTDAGSIL